MCQPAVDNGVIRVEGRFIKEVGAACEITQLPGEEVLDLGDAVVLPGLINAHCHLDYSTLRNAIGRPSGFSDWVQKLNSIKRQLSNEDVLEAISRGVTESMRFGTTSICSMAAFPDLIPRLPPAKVRTWWFYEMIDIRHRLTSEEMVAGALSFFESENDELTRYGLNPHAPYTASLLLYRLAQVCAEQHQMLLTTHISESIEESKMFEEADGPLYTFLKALGRPMDDCGHDTPFGWLWRNGAIRNGWILAHLNDLKDNDLRLLESLTPEQLPSVVHCPGSHAYFQHPPFQFRKLQSLGMNICVGTDSLASTDSLSLLSELRRLSSNEPTLSSRELLETVTVNPARALHMQGLLGCLSPGAHADLITVPIQTSAAFAADHCISHKGPVSWMMVDGKVSDLQTF